MVSFSVYCEYVPGVAVSYSPLRIGFTEGNDALHPHRVAQGLHRFGNALAHADPLGHRPDDLMGIGLFQLVIADILQNKVVNGQFLLQLTFPLQGPHEPLHPGGNSLLMGAYLALFKEVLRNKLHMVCPRIVPIAVPHHIKQQRRVQLQPQIYLRQPLTLQPGHPYRGRQRLQPGFHLLIGRLFCPIQPLIIVPVHTPFLSSFYSSLYQNPPPCQPRISHPRSYEVLSPTPS